MKEEDRQLAEQLGRSVTLEMSSASFTANRNRLAKQHGDDSDLVLNTIQFIITISVIITCAKILMSNRAILCYNFDRVVFRYFKNLLIFVKTKLRYCPSSSLSSSFLAPSLRVLGASNFQNGRF